MFIYLSSLPLLLSLAAGGLLAYALGLIIYRLALHPLAKYPSPLLARITDWHAAYHAWRGDRHLQSLRAHETYGNVVRVAPNTLSFNTNTALKDIYGHGHKANVQKSKFYEAFWTSKNNPNTHATINKVSHARKRRVLSHAFSDAAIKSMEKYVLANVQTFLNRLGETNANLRELKGSGGGWGPPKNVSNWCDYLTFDIMGDLAFGKPFHMLESETNRFARDLISNAAHRHVTCGTYPPLHKLHLDRILFPKIAAGRQRFIQYGKAQAEERIKLGPNVDRRDFFHYLLAARDPETGQGYGPAELWAEANLLIIAGSDTTATALAAALFYLVHNPHALERATKEIRTTFKATEDIVSGAALSRCEYLRACLDEAMRMSPPVGGMLPREVLEGGIMLDGHEIRAGTVVGVAAYAIHHNPDYYPDPFVFRPERWIAGSLTSISAESVALAHSAFSAFSIGPRGCIGKGLTYQELMLSLGRTLWMYDMRLAPGTHVGEGSAGLEWGRQRPGEFQLRDTFTSKKEGPLVQFRRAEGRLIDDHVS